MNAKLSHCMLWSTDVNQAANWYRDTLNFVIDYIAPGEYASLHHETMGRLALHADEKNEHTGRGAFPYYQVTDIEKSVAWLKDRQVKVEEIQQVGDSPKHTWFWDCHGNQLGLEQA